MAKIRTLIALQDTLDQEYGWRIKEIAALKLSVRSANSLSEATLIRAGIAIAYAHWEGFVKAAAESYVEYVRYKGLRYSELKPCFAVMGVKSHLQSILTSKNSAATAAAYDFIASNIDKEANLSLFGAVNTESNLSSTVFQNIADSINIDTSWYQPLYNFIDKELLLRRNKIAHGERLDIDAPAWRDLADNVISALRSFKTDIENAASLGAYKRVA